MGRVRDATTRMVVSVAVIGTIAALSACAPVGTSVPDPAVGRPLPPPVDKTVVEAPPLGLDVRYVDEDGNFSVLRVRDFSR